MVLTSRVAATARGLLALLAVMALAACGFSLLPPDGAPPGVVLAAYLRVLERGDCATSRSLTTSTFIVGNGDLCGVLDVTAFSVPDGAARPSDGEVVYSTTLTTRGGDVSMPDGNHTWFYSLVRQPDGEWRIAGGGSGP